MTPPASQGKGPKQIKVARKHSQPENGYTRRPIEWNGPKTVDFLRNWSLTFIGRPTDRQSFETRDSGVSITTTVPLVMMAVRHYKSLPASSTEPPGSMKRTTFSTRSRTQTVEWCNARGGSGRGVTYCKWSVGWKEWRFIYFIPRNRFLGWPLSDDNGVCGSVAKDL